MDPLLHAPDFPSECSWLNTDRPLSLAGNLKGQVVLLDFWTYCCINCMHVLPDLEYLEEKFKNDPVVIIGVHSAKYDNERDAANVRAAIERYTLNHPVLLDQGHRVWSAYDVNAWPTLILIGSDGRIIGGVSGEGHRALLENRIYHALAEGQEKGTLAAGPLKFGRGPEVRAPSQLAFPGKVVPDLAGNRLFIVDSNHHRILITTYPGEDGRVSVREIVGTGTRGAADGAFDAAQFYRPQGAVLSGHVLFVADTENHLVRRIDLEKKAVTTVLGTGKQTFDPDAGKTGREQGLNSPWDVAVGNNRLYVSQAGQHQIFAMNLMTGMTEVTAGSGRENIRDGKARSANLAQPSGIALDAARQVLYFADAEVSAVRGVDLKAGEVFTLVGLDLFEFGDLDGDPETARLQHALGVAIAEEGRALLVADTYNHKIRRIDVGTRHTTTIAGSGKRGNGVGAAVQFNEPAGVAVTDGDVFVADTNNHRILRLCRRTGEWMALKIEGLPNAGAPVHKH